MRYQFTFRNTASDLLKISLYYTYRTFAGTVNLVFTAATAILMAVKLKSGEFGIAIAAGIAMLYFPLIQPLIIYLKSRKTAESCTEDTSLSFTDDRIYIAVGEKTQEMTWKEIPAVQKLPVGVLLYTGKSHGLMVPNRELKEKREEFYQFVLKNVRNAQRQ